MYTPNKAHTDQPSNSTAIGDPSYPPKMTTSILSPSKSTHPTRVILATLPWGPDLRTELFETVITCVARAGTNTRKQREQRKKERRRPLEHVDTPVRSDYRVGPAVAVLKDEETNGDPTFGCMACEAAGAKQQVK